MLAFTVFKSKDYTKLFLASFASRMGSVIGMTALVFYLLKRFSSQPFYATLNEMMYSLPTVFVFFIVGVAADRLDRQKIAVASDGIRAGLSLCLILTLVMNWIPGIFILLFLRESVSKFFSPAESAIIQGILTKDQYAVAAGLNQMTSSVFTLFGNGLGILAYWTIGVKGAIMVDALSYIISGLLIYSCHLSVEARLPNGLHKISDLKLGFVLKDFKQGIQYILSNKLLLYIVLGFVVFGIVNGGFSVMPIYILKYKLAPHSYEQLSIWLGVVFGGGLLIGSLVATLVASKVKEYYLMPFGILLLGLIVGLIAFTTHIILYFVMIFLLSLVLPFINIAIGGWLPQLVKPTMMGRVEGCIDPLMMISQTITLGIISLTFPVYLSINALYWVVGGCLFFVGVYYLIMLPRQATKNKEATKEDLSVETYKI